MQKYGIEHFQIELIEECDDALSSEREQYWIGYYKGYEEGYNATRGGEGTFLYDHTKIEELLRQGKSSSEIVEEIGCSIDTVYNVAKKSNFQLTGVNSTKKEMLDSRIKVAQYELTGEFIQFFDSYAEAARWLFDNGKIKKLSSGVRSHIGEVCNGTRKTAYKYKWKKM